MDDTNLLTTIDAVGGLPPSPRFRFKGTFTLLEIVLLIRHELRLRLKRRFKSLEYRNWIIEDHESTGDTGRQLSP
ncbi:hypothetical protein MKW98_031157 [Papaver atlanticum]|uniref:Uncharacterized protein n=1 Tax=Papaver atlanticum TaxID=357466 RepID=A0AAD4XLC9_9MAGN|nr:hypothetical protein MKW98_031157 [Papaver atlanticum]